MFPRDQCGRSRPHSLAATTCSRNVGICVFCANRIGSPRCQNPSTKMSELRMNRASASEQFLANHLALVACRRGHANAQLIGLVPAACHLRRLSRRVFGIVEYVAEATQAHAVESRDLQQPDYSSRGGISSFPKKLTIEKNVGFLCATPSAPVTASQSPTPPETRGGLRKLAKRTLPLSLAIGVTVRLHGREIADRAAFNFW
ncbi:hypothetical protein R8871_06442 [Paraburkholderia graminis C4D1M]|uniref:Uncharacterized protein n=1 Tax=Paraburkholderia graminis (strain ATCC 700544 / DSM 17151 / LMG 18924 / NCIMB 13744 / C4D1M) TaxID=396598 RepID=B1G659_PARG4|nr:hypothetical protein BgramDRAFT_4761 [Paraburkholderia graminis C4D1M]CAB3738756.1 hypothetical protein R8871_06442 [Paraburkholderia graminis C4D1M]